MPCDALNRLTRDHPRGCGEHPPIYTATWSASGSSPRMRGTLAVGRQAHGRLRIIPADAGNTAPAALFWTGPGDHPRGCGEHLASWTCLDSAGGSSPRMRGTRKGLHGDWQLRGIIPADAGNTLLVDVRRTDAGDHPRGCGEHFAQSPLGHTKWGSSPRMRGTHCDFGDPTAAKGIIPADAGNTCQHPATRRATTDHPRGCGEH